MGTLKARSQQPEAGRRRALSLGCWLLAFGFTLLFPRPASADLVYLKNGRVLSVDAWQINGDVAVLSLRDGGRIEAPEALIEDVLPDEYFHARLQALPESLAIMAPKSDDIRGMVDATATRYGVDIKLAHALVKVESNYQANALSPKGAMGLMQLMPSVAKQYALDNPFDPAKNLDAGIRHLRTLLDRFPQDTKLALAAYNAGLFAVTKYGGVPPYRETQDYVRRIMTLAR